MHHQPTGTQAYIVHALVSQAEKGNQDETSRQEGSGQGVYGPARARTWAVHKG
ncbi:hypothetical protein DUNSADRAFT_3916 [Dunaliella salina]|uniref:Encoded protein n=1 Tax=Dunaliella salina TaxID=3046 RepID=A0ABQ7GT37_DUNSA|nr:hypothetical protein DUNSADRAFT_3916 [Dunaliella salina]|eukprot:KAF5837773.1 hypothetical protein DUNSADRAFT_3916 [Dunaliella salina]